MGLVLPMAAALIVGVALGLFTFKLKQRWCPACGATLECPDSVHHAEHLT